MTADLSELIAKVKEQLPKVTRGPWEIYTEMPTPEVLAVQGPSEIVYGLDGICTPDRLNDRTFAEDAANMRFIALLNPVTVSALLSRIEELESAKWKQQHVDTMNDMASLGIALESAEARATSAETKLAEAVKVIEPFAESHFMGDAYVKFAPRLIIAARSFLQSLSQAGGADGK